MITDAILSLLLAPLIALVDLFPAASSVDWSTSWSQYLIYADLFVNMPLLMTLVGFWVTYELSIIGIRLAIWVYKMIPLNG